jgi:hypothetical protein
MADMMCSVTGLRSAGGGIFCKNKQKYRLVGGNTPIVKKLTNVSIGAFVSPGGTKFMPKSMISVSQSRKPLIRREENAPYAQFFAHLRNPIPVVGDKVEK